MSLITFPIRLVLSIAGLTFRAGVKVGEVPVRTGSVAVRRLGLKAVIVLVIGIAVGFVIGQRFAHLGHDHDHGDGERYIDGHAAPTVTTAPNADAA